MNSFSRPGKKFGATGGKPKGNWNRAGAGKPAPRELHDAVCSDCGNACKVPFFPSGTRPVKCRDCFQPNEDRAPRSFERPAYQSRPHSEDRFDRPAPRSYDRPDRSVGGGDIEARLKSIERKIDNLLELLDADDVE